MIGKTEREFFKFPVRIGSLHIQVILADSLYYKKESFHFLPHNHSRYELLYVLEGPLYALTPKVDFIAVPGDLCIIHPYEYHTYLRPRDDIRNILLFCCSFYIESTDHSTDDDIDLQGIIPKLDQMYKLHDDSESLLVLLIRIQEELAGRKPGFLITVKSLLTALFVSIFRELSAGNTEPKISSDYSYNAKREFTIESFFLSNYMKEPNISDLGRQLHVCTRRTSQIIKQLYGCSYSQKLVETRIEIAKLYLLYSEYGISQISKMCGFNSQNYFFTAFRKAVGTSPLQYRKKTKKLFESDVYCKY